MHIKSTKLKIIRKSDRISKFKDKINPPTTVTKNKSLLIFNQHYIYLEN